MAAKRARGVVFTQEEKDILKEVLVGVANIIENKKTDAFSSLQKTEAWERVAITFNSYSRVRQRTAAQLRKAWENMKSLKKKQASALLQHRSGTGGGPSLPDLPDDPLMDVEFDSHAYAVASYGHESRSCSPHSTIKSITGTPVFDQEDAGDDDSDDGLEQPLPLGLRFSCAGDGATENSALMGLSSISGGTPSCKIGHVREQSSTGPVQPVGRSTSNARKTSVRGNAPINDTASSTATVAMGVLSGEHGVRMQQLELIQSQRNELHVIHMREAAALERTAVASERAATERARYEEFRARDMENQFHFNERMRHCQMRSERDKSPCS